MPNINPITALLTIIFLYPIVKGLLFKFSSKDLKIDLEELSKTLSFIVALFLGIYYGRRIFFNHDDGVYKILYNLIPSGIVNYIEDKPFVIYLILIPILMFIIYKITFLVFHLFHSITFYPMLDNLEDYLKRKNNFFKSIAGALFQLPRAIAYLLFVTLVLNLSSMFYKNGLFNQYLSDSKTYNYLCYKVVIPVTKSKLASKLPTVINNSFRIVIKEGSKDVSEKNTIVYYNGVTLNEGIKSNDRINEFAKRLVSKEESTKSKAKIIYNWVGSNIVYDYDKADKVLNNEFNIKSGAIYAFDTKKGICFDYACLFVAMCRANGIKVRLITGEGFNGVSWVNHAWNQVYIPEEDVWINVDSTFYKGGNYFDNKRFDTDHKEEKIAGEWQ
ncbi:transglutaminase-like domain-containing protein [Clostridium malenominatum]|uniref:Transglutaminase-like domain-containing protein n=1 Tax=Clostridium malenominatum TaxID=1539 RepID=A0ABN1INJ6_9CLOT